MRNFLRRLFHRAPTSLTQMPSLAKLTDWFDDIICISLPTCQERRDYIRQYFGEIGIQRYSMFDAIAADSPIVEDYYWQERVKRYPDCFRCHKLECGRPACNNVLIPSQVATWISHQTVWEQIRDRGLQTALIVEDDIQFNEHAPLVLQQLVERDEFRQEFLSDRPCLLRLGWKLRADHEYHGSIELVTKPIRMSNPCYAINRAMAIALIDHVKQVDTTVDVYVHRQIAPKFHHYTVVPPLAHEHSASTGSLASLIHPKQQHIDYLMQQQADEAAIASARKMIDQHIKHAIIQDVLCVGHPRCGSGYVSQLLGAFGLEIGHERMDAHGISSWMFAVDDAYYPYGKDKYARSRRYTHFRYIIHHVRSPFDAIPSLIVENQHSEKSFAFRRKHILRYFGIDLATLSPIDAAVASFIYWNRIIELMKPDVIIRIENDQESLFHALQTAELLEEEAQFSDVELPPKTVNARKPYKGAVIDKPVLTEDDWESLSSFFKAELRFFRKQYGYDFNEGGLFI
jgi:GR25 family glycosyltransferase involved in LPS biosynthesis